MRRFLPQLCFVLCLLLGLSTGYYLGYTRPAAKKQRELLDQYHYVRDHFHMTDEQMAEAGPKMKQYFEDMKRTDELAAVVALGAFRYLERGDTEGSKLRLLGAIGSYYRVYHGKGGDTNIMAQIERAAQEHPAIATEISRKIE